MDKVLALAHEEQQMQLRFKEKIALCENVVTKKSEIENIEKQLKKLQQEINTMEPQVLQTQIDIKMLDTQRVELMKNIKDKLTRVIKDEEKLKNSMGFFLDVSKEKIEQAKELLHNIETKDNNNTAIETEKLEIEATQKRVWALRGEVEALELFENYQTKKIEEINRIVDKVEAVIQENNDIEM